ncbi:GNAT family N-acetyltransferase [Microbacterium sp. QXD-8]|uniref:GNAT family N-acetyltransferase n=1 Tax=Microbacterium psychrotolerans TaxID=3068321 RepID=A0ABU0YZ86_9MICO|nr:GNAT family N-acetyltransferase [Microbacterium sp. QXD-8]MDQ7876884.1 GNAT family N-acetyltransferase [Microbacterium sp. QXD-8]
MTVEITAEIPSATELVELYRAVGWTAYTNDPEGLVDAINGSFDVLTARSADGELIGLARTVSDGRTIAYLQDILVAPDHHRRGVGGALLDEVLHRTRHIRQLVLLTDAEDAQRAFYESRGFVEAHDFTPNQLRSFVRIG